MDYSEMNLGSWASYLPKFKDLLRPEGSGPSQPDEDVEEARERDSSKSQITEINNTLPELVFEGYSDWAGYQDDWVLRNLGHVLTAADEDEILRRLDAGSADSLSELLTFIVDTRLSVWRAAAAEEFTGAADGELEGAENEGNWAANRTPGTYYYTYAADDEGNMVYLYSDRLSAPRDEWKSLPEREDEADANAQPWGDGDWWYTAVNPDATSLYGCSHVYREGPDGPWLAENDANARIVAQGSTADTGVLDMTASPHAVSAVVSGNVTGTSTARDQGGPAEVAVEELVAGIRSNDDLAKAIAEITQEEFQQILTDLVAEHN
jgi:hypothetical protein